MYKRVYLFINILFVCAIFTTYFTDDALFSFQKLMACGLMTLINGIWSLNCKLYFPVKISKSMRVFVIYIGIVSTTMAGIYYLIKYF